jgi:hypothetical protein
VSQLCSRLRCDFRSVFRQGREQDLARCRIENAYPAAGSEPQQPVDGSASPSRLTLAIAILRSSSSSVYEFGSALVTTDDRWINGEKGDELLSFDNEGGPFEVLRRSASVGRRKLMLASRSRTPDITSSRFPSRCNLDCYGDANKHHLPAAHAPWPSPARAWQACVLLGPGGPGSRARQ